MHGIASPSNTSLIPFKPCYNPTGGSYRKINQRPNQLGSSLSHICFHN
uniref:Uncharacterized protein n=1 Tax=Setaria italica TaxID=4555 RepID=K4AN99_SETIT